MLRRARSVLLALAASAALASCYDTVDLDPAGTSTPESSCDPACSGDQRCHPEHHVCVPCTEGDENCGDGDDDDDDGPPICDASSPGPDCIQCRASSDCGDAGPLCIGGFCFQCRDDRDCPFPERCIYARCEDDNHGPGNPDDDHRR
jgi:hypothetical protein